MLTKALEILERGFAADGRKRVAYLERFEKRPALNSTIDLATTTGPTETEFNAFAAANLNWQAGGTNMTAALCTHSTGGGIVLTTAGAASDQATILPHTDSGLSGVNTTDWSTSDQLIFVTRIVTPATITSYECRIGWVLTNPTAFDLTTDDDQFHLTFDTAVGANWIVNYSVGGTDYDEDTGEAVTASTAYDLVLVIESGRKGKVFINPFDGGRHYQTANALTAAIDLLPTVGVQTLTTAARALTCRYVGVSKLDND